MSDDTKKTEPTPTSEGGNVSQSGAGGEMPQDSKYNPQDLTEAQKIIEALQKRIAEREAERDEAKRAATTHEQRLAAIEAARKKKLEEDGNYAELLKAREAELETYRPKAERADVLEQMIRQSNERRIEQIPEGMRSIVPLDYPPEKLSAWLDASAGLLSKPSAPDIGAGAGASGSGSVSKVSDGDIRAARLASQFGWDIKPETLAKRRRESQSTD